MKPTEETSVLLRALKQAKAIDLDKLFASGIDITINDYTHEDREHMERVSVTAETFAPVKEALIKCLLINIQLRQQSLTRELASVNIAINGSEECPF